MFLQLVSNKRYTAAIDPQKVRETILTNCGCGRDCLSKVAQDDILKIRELFHSKSREEKMKFLAHEFRATDYRKDGLKDHQHTLLIGVSETTGGTAVCPSAWRLAHGISKTS